MIAPDLSVRPAALSSAAAGEGSRAPSGVGGAAPTPSTSSFSPELADAIAFGMQAERERIAAIMNDPAAEAFPRMAWLLARNGDVTLEQAREAFAINLEQLAINAAMSERETAVTQ